jgi:hypothetical protein
MIPSESPLKTWALVKGESASRPAPARGADFNLRTPISIGNGSRPGVFARGR